MTITPRLADRLYTAMVQTISAPDDYHRWAFIYAITELRVDRYLIDSRLGIGARFHMARPPLVVCHPDALSPHREELVRRANAELCNIMPPIRTIAIHDGNRRTSVPIRNTIEPALIDSIMVGWIPEL
jgi:hypothetical protein